MRLRASSFLMVVAGLLVAGNLTILAAVLLARRRRGRPEPAIGGIPNSVRVDGRLWRGAAPGDDGYHKLAEAGAATVVDLRAEGGSGPDPSLGMEYVRIPVRDGQPPSTWQVAEFLEVMRDGAAPVYLHCAAGVGRTGSMTAAYRVLERGEDVANVLRRALAIGPPSLEQIAFIAGLDRGAQPPPTWVVVVSRILDAPRRTWSRIRQALAKLG